MKHMLQYLTGVPRDSKASLNSITPHPAGATMCQRIFLICMSVSAAATAQISRLVTNSDGSIAYFSSPMKLLGDGSEASWSKIFRYSQDTGKIELAYQITSYAAVNSWGSTTPYMLSSPDINSDGSILAYTATGSGVCYGGGACLAYTGAYGHIVQIQNGSSRVLPGGGVKLSRNGKYVLSYASSYVGSVSPANQTLLLDMQSDQTADLGTRVLPTGDGYQVISDSGIVLIGNSLFNPSRYDAAQSPASAYTQLNMSQKPILERLSANGKRIVYEAYAVDHAVLMLYEIDSGQETMVVQGPVNLTPPAQVSPTFQPWLSDDGSLLLYLDSPSPGFPRQVFLLQTNGASAATQLTSEPEGITNAVLSGSGNIVYAVTVTNRILRIQTASQTIRELSGASTNVSGSGVPGSFVHLTGFAIPTDSGPGSVKIGGLDVPVQNATSTSLDVQIPWELFLPDLSGSQIPVTFVNESTSAFDRPVISVYYSSPVFLRLPQTDPSISPPGVIAHQDFHGLVTPSDPAKPGEILHFYMTGLGPVSPAIATGQITPSDTLYTATSPPACMFFSGEQALEVPAPLLFAGLAPGMLGIYQVDVQMPAAPLHDTFGCIAYLPKINQTDYVAIPTGP